MAEGNRGIELSEGDEFAGYRIERNLGRGGMGVLYLALEPGLERKVALKLIAPEAAADEVFTRRFEEESRIAASIEHPNVVPIYAAGEVDGVAYIAMRFVPGSDLGKRLAREGRLELSHAVALIAQVGSGLDAIHTAGLIHRDVKPANVLLSGEPGSEHAYITDFGVARNLATNSGLTQTGRFVGTLDYVAPEQISGGEVDARVDVYALGCVLFTLLTGEVPFPRDGEAARLYAHLNDPPPAPSLYVPEVSMGLDDVVIRAMSKEPGDRYPSAGDLGRAALAALSGERPVAPERTVATGAAATRTAETVSLPPGEREKGQAGPRGKSRTAATRRLAAPDSRPKKRDGRQIWALLGALAAASVVAIALVLGGGGDGGDPTTADRGSTGSQGDASKTPSPDPAPRSLSRAELIAKGDEICADSQSTYKEALTEFPEGETTADATYAERLVGISTPAVKRFRALTPPPSLEGPYKEYVQAQQRVNAYDVQALRAAEDEDESAYLAARERRDEEQRERYELARQIGFEACSASPE